jgi:transketolase
MEDSLRRFEHSSRETFEKSLSDMEFSREGALSQLQEKIDERILQGVEQAKTQLESHLEPFMEAIEMKRHTQQREWTEQLEKATNASMEQYKARLENATNSWLLGAATTLGQHSQAVLDTLAKAAERRLRETCRDVLAGMGETLKSRMMGLSTDLTEEETDGEKPAKK